MGGATTTTLASLIKPVVEPALVDGVFHASPVFSYFPAPVPSGGDTGKRWLIHSTGNTSVEEFSEGQPLPQAGSQGYVAAVDTYRHFRMVYSVTGHAQAALQSAYVPAAVASELIDGMADLVQLIHTTFINDLETAVDSTSTYAGITRGAATYFESLETAVNGALSIDDLEDLIEGLLDNDRGANQNNLAWMMPMNQATNIYRLTGTPATQMIGDSDKAPSFLRQTLMGRPMIQVQNWTDTVIALLDMSPQHWAHTWHSATGSPVEIVEQGKSADSDVFVVNMRRKLSCKHPKLQAKLTGVVA